MVHPLEKEQPQGTLEEDPVTTENVVQLQAPTPRKVYINPCAKVAGLSLYIRLAAAKQQQLGTSSCLRLSDQDSAVSTPGKASHSSSVCRQTSSHHLRQGAGIDRQRSHCGVYRRCYTRIYVQQLLGPKYRGKILTCHQSQKPQ